MGETNMDIMEKRIRKLEQRNKDQRAAINSAVEHLQPFVQSEFIHKSELEELIKEWRAEASDIEDGEGDLFKDGWRASGLRCADEIEELVK